MLRHIHALKVINSRSGAAGSAMNYRARLNPLRFAIPPLSLKGKASLPTRTHTAAQPILPD